MTNVTTQAHICDGSRASCVRCAALAKRHDELRTVLTLDERIDEVTRARIWSRLSARLAGTPRVIAAPRRWRMPVAVACALAAAAALAFVLLPKPASVEPNALIAPAKTTLSTRLGPHTRVALVGPARLEIVGEAGDRTTVRLASGALHAHFNGGTGRSLRVIAPGVVVDVVGTLFAVEITDHRTCVSVAHGRVRITTPTTVREVSTDQRVCSDAAASPIDPRLRHALGKLEVELADRDRDIEPVAASHASPSAEAAPAAQNIEPSAAPQPPGAARPHAAAPPIAATTAMSQRPAAPSSAGPQPTASTHAAVPAPSVPQPAAVPPRVSPPPAAAPPRATPDELYRTAEGALARRDLAAADRALAQLLADAPTSTLADEALYERAYIAYQRRAWSDARHHLDTLATTPRTALAEPGHYLACRVAIEAHDSDAARCLADYRARFPDSPHDREALGMVVQLAYEHDRCRAARPYIDELARKYAGSALARAWSSRCTEHAP